MASSGFSAENALDALKTPGFYSVDDHDAGKCAAESFEDIDTEIGYQFYMQHFRNDTRISDTLKSSLGPCKLVAYRTFTPDSRRIFQFRRGGEEADCILVVLLWPPGSEVIYYGDSLKHKLFAVDADNGLLRVPHAQANHAGCGEGKVIHLERGGLSIQDGRTLFTFVAGKPIAATFASDKFLTKWRWNKRLLSTTEEMKRKLNASEDEDFGFYVEFTTKSTPQITDQQ